jgi:hypothetical protein
MVQSFHLIKLGFGIAAQNMALAAIATTIRPSCKDDGNSNYTLFSIFFLTLLLFLKKPSVIIYHNFMVYYHCEQSAMVFNENKQNSSLSINRFCSVSLTLPIN